MARKPHPSSVLKVLPDDDQAALFDFLREHTLAEGVAWLFSNNGVRTNDSSLSEWRSWYKMSQDIAAWDNDIASLQEQLAGMGTDPDLIPKIGEAVFISRAAKSGDAKTFATVASVIQRHRELQASQQQHVDKMQVKGKELEQRDKTIAQKDEVIEMQRRKIEALEAQAEAAKKAAEKTKEALKSGGMDEATRKALMEEMDQMILGVKKATKPTAS
jgi:hypothetical protein